MKDNKMFKEFIPKMLADVIGHDMMKHGDFDIHLPKGTLTQVFILRPILPYSHIRRRIQVRIPMQRDSLRIDLWL